MPRTSKKHSLDFAHDKKGIRPLNAREVAEIHKLIQLANAAIPNAMNSIQHYQLEGMRMGFEIVLKLGSEAEGYAHEKARLKQLSENR